MEMKFKYYQKKSIKIYQMFKILNNLYNNDNKKIFDEMIIKGIKFFFL